MKTIFLSLLIINILFAVTMFFLSNQPHRDAESPVVNPEKIILLPASVRCIEWGEFSEQNLQLVDLALNRLNLQKPYKQIVSNSLIKYWVHTAPFPNRQSVEREINKLRNMGIISYRVRTEGPWLNAVSFGDYNDKTTAQNVIIKLNGKGLTNAKISKREINQKKYLFFETNPANITALQNLAAQFTGSKLELKTCERL